MNLIEQLGGYAQAKNWLDKIEIHVEHGYLEKYLAELLEYRRQHNIFEVGDLVVFSNNPCGLNHSIYKITRAIDNISRFTAVAPICGINGRLVVEAGFYVEHPFKIQHATPEEIKAGKRLP